jgi:hypothetical protein
MKMVTMAKTSVATAKTAEVSITGTLAPGGHVYLVSDVNGFVAGMLAGATVAGFRYPITAGVEYRTKATRFWYRNESGGVGHIAVRADMVSGVGPDAASITVL